ncbi:MAG TPA: GNAT family N-acetyltransferase [Acidimicrobiia bacterium]|nr:GNAT family N-acetyltransferase [Acidimicrobiia bacterium]
MRGAPNRGDQGVIRIRGAAETDAPAIADLHGRSFRATYPNLPKTMEGTKNGSRQRVELWTNRLQKPVADCGVLVAEDRGRIQGFVYSGPTRDTDDDPRRTGQVFSIHVDPPAWGAGVGSDLLDNAVANLRSSGFEDATLWVVDENRRARMFYEARGWKLDGGRRKETLAVGHSDGDEVDVIRYRRQLITGGDR